jgi:glutathione S-transferase
VTKLYDAPLSPFAARCRIQIYAKALPIGIAPPPGGLGSDEFRRVSPLGKVPALDLGESVLPESEVICEYLEDAHPTPPMRPADPLARARGRLLSRFVDLYLIPPLTILFGQVNPKTRDAKLVSEKLAEVAMRLDQLEGFVGSGPYAVGDSLGLADCALAPIFFFLVRLVPLLGGGDPLASRPRLRALEARQREHPAVARALDEMAAALAEMMRGAA